MANAEAAGHLHDWRKAIALLVVAFADHGPDPLRQLVGQTLSEHWSECISHYAVSH
jgi:hypothetical protein